MSVLDEIKRTQSPTNPPKVGYQWLTMLIKYNYVTGESELIRTFTKAAAQSEIKQKFTKKASKEPKIEIDETVEKKGLFD